MIFYHTLQGLWEKPQVLQRLENETTINCKLPLTVSGGTKALADSHSYTQSGEEGEKERKAGKKTEIASSPHGSSNMLSDSKWNSFQM